MKGNFLVFITGILILTIFLDWRMNAQDVITPGHEKAREKEDFGFGKDFSIPVINSEGLFFEQPWVGGLNACQFTEVDLDVDGILDLVVFDRHGNRILPFINKGKRSRTSYTYAPEYQARFPAIREWMNLVDYDMDGKNDLFTYTTGGIRVYRNVSDTILAFALEKSLLYSYYYTGFVNLFALPDDYPVFSDVDLDGDMDILNFFSLGKYLNFHRNLSVENYGIPDSLDFRLAELCWGHFEENELSNVLYLGIDCESRSLNDVSDRHAGSTLLALDLDDDLDKDLIVGDVDYSTIVRLVNGGSADSAFMVSQDTLFPSGTVPVDLMSMPLCTYVDINNDGARDLLVSPFDPGLDRTENTESVWLYRNLGRSDKPVFHLEQKDFMQEWMIDLGAGAYPVIADVNGDGLMDLVVGNFGYLDTTYYSFGYLYLIYRSQVSLFLNTGTAADPEFRLTDSDFGNLSSLMIRGAYPALADLDDDRDMDMLAGSADGTILFLENLAGTGQIPGFASPVMNYQGIDVGEFSTPQLIDLDRDGLTDLIAGKRNGTLSYYRNTGSAEAPVFTLITEHLGDVDVTDDDLSLDGFSTPCFFETDGEYRLFAGSEFGPIYYYKDVEENLTGAFTLVSDHYLYIDEGARTGFAVWNYNNDTYPDLFAGNYSGGLALYRGVTPDELGMKEVKEIPRSFKVYPNPSCERITIEVSGSFLNDGYDVELTDLLGRQVFCSQNLSEKTVSLAVGDLPSGIYLVTVRNPNGFIEACKLLKY